MRVYWKKLHKLLTLIGFLFLVFCCSLVAAAPQEQDGTSVSPDAGEGNGDVGKQTSDTVVLPEQQKELSEMEKRVEDFNQEAGSYKQEIQRYIERKYDEQRKAVVGSYERVIRDLERDEKERRTKAIEAFENFLAKHQNDTNYTPGILWRLGELHYEQSKLDYAREEDEYSKKLVAFGRGETTVEPVPPIPRYEKTVSVLQRLIRDFPDFKYSDGAHYLIAYCLQEQGEDEEAQDAYLAIINNYPKSKYIPEVLTRLGESYFEDPNKLDKAIEAYRRVLSFPDSVMYDKALYKLAWTYYKIDQYEQASVRFDELISWTYKEVEGQEKGEVVRSELREEAMQYLAVCFASDEWSGSGVGKAAVFFQRLGGRKYDGEFFRKLGGIYYIEAKYDKSIEAYREAIKRYPTHPENPKLMSTIVDAYYRMQDGLGAAKAQEEFLVLFGPGSAWRRANQDTPDMIVEADTLAKNALNASAVRHHVLAQRLKQQNKPEAAAKEYALAARLYNDYLNRFQNTRETYQLTYYLAECYYYSLDFKKAAETYSMVRDSAAGTQFLAESANAVVLSYMNLIKEAEKTDTLKPLVLYTSKNRPENFRVNAKTIPDLRLKLVQACETYAKLIPNDEQTFHMRFRAAQVYYAYDHFEKAREHFTEIVAETKDKDLATSSINLIIESYLVTQDWEQVQTWSQKLATLSRDPRQKKTLKKWELGARFNRASEMMQSGKKLMDEGKSREGLVALENAAKEYIRLVDEDPANQASDKALNNAAICYITAKRPRSAGRVFERIVKDYPKSEFADRALFLMAGTAENSYQFQDAIDTYMKLVHNYPKSEHRADALYNAAVTLEDDQQYDQAARAYERYATLFPNRPDANDNFFRAGTMYEKLKDWPKVISLYQRFIVRYRKAPMHREKIVVAKMKIAQAQAALGQKQKAIRGYNETLALYKQYRLKAGGIAAESAAKASFMLAEAGLESYKGITFNVPPKMLKKTLDRKANMLKRMERDYKEVWRYKRVQWTLAAYYRLGYLYENFADVLVKAPCPKAFGEEECDLYKGKLMDWAEAPIKKAVAAYTDTMAKSKELKVINEWTQAAYESLNRFEPMQYPMQKEPLNSLVVDRLASLPTIQRVESH